MKLVDASVAIKWYLAEEGSAAAEALFSEHELAAPELLLAEVGNALWKAWRRDAISEEAANAAMGNLAGRFSTLQPLLPLAGRAGQIARQLDHPVYDCFYLAHAEQRQEQLVTADKRLLTVVAGTEFAGLLAPLA